VVFFAPTAALAIESANIETALPWDTAPSNRSLHPFRALNNRRGFVGLKEVSETLEEAYQSELFATIT